MKPLRLLLVFVFALVGVYLSQPTPAMATVSGTTEHTVTLTTSGWLSDLGVNRTLLDCRIWGNTQSTASITTTTTAGGRTIDYLAATTGDTSLPTDYSHWDETSPGRRNGGVKCGDGAADGCYATITGNAATRLVCHYRTN